MNKQNKKTIIVVATMLALAAVIYLILRVSTQNSLQNEKVAVISVNGKEFTRRALLNEPQEIVVGEGANIIEIDQNGVRMKHADCPDQNCVHFGYILAKDPQSHMKKIICLPNQVIVELVGSKDEASTIFDIVAQ